MNNLKLNIEHFKQQNNNDKNLFIKKMIFIHNALQEGWNIKLKENNTYIFSKKHEGKKEVFLDSYLQDFIINNFNNEHIII